MPLIRSVYVQSVPCQWKWERQTKNRSENKTNPPHKATMSLRRIKYKYTTHSHAAHHNNMILEREGKWSTS